jgi:hypothetical protein
MPTSVGTKAGKKQSSLSKKDAIPAGDRDFEHSLMILENVCFLVMNTQFFEGRNDVEGRTWQERFINIATPVSLALAEYKGPRHFHYHYRHSPTNDAVLQPVLENPVDTLAHACQVALNACRNDLVGIQDAVMLETKTMLEQALGAFLQQYEHYSSQITQ